jgi:hypothetical protein
MTRAEYLKLMRFPAEWDEWGLIDEVWLTGAMRSYEPGMEDASEHDRNAAFHWWLRRSPSKDVLLKLAKLTWLDPEPLMGEDVRTHIAKAKACDAEVRAALER